MMYILLKRQCSELCTFAANMKIDLLSSYNLHQHGLLAYE